MPPDAVVPYSVPFTLIKPADGSLPSLPSPKRWRTLNELLEAGYGAAHAARVFKVVRSTLCRALAAT